MAKEYWITNSRFKLIVIIMVFMWLIVIGFLYIKTDEVTKDPCRICAERHGENVFCTTVGDSIPARRTYYTNGTIYDEVPGVLRSPRDSMFNLSNINLSGD